MLAATLLAHSPPAQTTTVIRAGLPELSDRADLVVEGRVLSVSEYLAPGGMAYTDYQIRISGRFKGASEDRLVVRLPGGAGTVVLGTPKLVPGTDVLLFLERGHVGDTWVVLGLGQGHFVLDGGEFRRQFTDVGYVDLAYCTGGEALDRVSATQLRRFLSARFGGQR